MLLLDSPVGSDSDRSIKAGVNLHLFEQSYNLSSHTRGKKLTTWQCVKNCGACCHLNPADRPDLADYLTPTELAHYLKLVGDDGWCIHYDQQQRICQIYPNRPRFCRVEPETFQAMYGINPEDLDEFAIECCQAQIEGVYGADSAEMERFQTALEISAQDGKRGRP